MNINYFFVKVKLFFLFFLTITTFSCFSQIDSFGIIDKLIHSTLRIESTVIEKNISGSLDTIHKTGTGFFYSFQIDSLTNIPVIVTNSHLVKNAISGTIFFLERDEKGNPLYGKETEVNLTNFKQEWLYHPNNLDICIAYALPIISEIPEGKRPYYVSINKEFIPNENMWNKFTSFSDVIVTGYQLELWDSYNKTPIGRKGTTASPPRLDYEGKKEFLVDIAAYEGLSGSPVFMPVEYRRKIKNGFSFGTEYYFLGIFFESPPNYIVEGNFKREGLPSLSELNIEIKIPVNTAKVLKSSVLLDFLPMIQEQRIPNNLMLRVIKNYQKN